MFLSYSRRKICSGKRNLLEPLRGRDRGTGPFATISCEAHSDDAVEIASPGIVRRTDAYCFCPDSTGPGSPLEVPVVFFLHDFHNLPKSRDSGD